MLAHHFKNFLTLLYKLNSVITIYCKNNNKLVCSDTSDNSILYQFEFESPNLLEENKTYVISLPDIHRLFKYIKSSSILFFTHNSHNSFDETSHLIIKSTHENIVQELKFPIIITNNVSVISCYDFNKTFTLNPILIRLNDLSRMIKALKNTADTYEIIHESDNLFKISNIDSIIPVSYCITSPSETSTDRRSETSRIVVNNYSLLRLNKLYCDNSVVKIHKNSINYESENGDVSYYIALENLE